jgi:hypothetical protein
MSNNSVSVSDAPLAATITAKDAPMLLGIGLAAAAAVAALIVLVYWCVVESGGGK